MTGHTFADLRTPGPAAAKHIFPFDAFLAAISCPLCQCSKSGDAVEPNTWQECCEDSDCRCHLDERWLGESKGDLPVCPECLDDVADPDPDAAWPQVLYHPACFAAVADRLEDLR